MTPDELRKLADETGPGSPWNPIKAISNLRHAILQAADEIEKLEAVAKAAKLAMRATRGPTSSIRIMCDSDCGCVFCSAEQAIEDLESD